MIREERLISRSVVLNGVFSLFQIYLPCSDSDLRYNRRIMNNQRNGNSRAPQTDLRPRVCVQSAILNLNIQNPEDEPMDLQVLSSTTSQTSLTHTHKNALMRNV